MKNWKEVVFAHDCIFEDWDIEKEMPICPKCKTEYANCSCPGPTQEEFEYMEKNGKMYARTRRNCSITTSKIPEDCPDPGPQSTEFTFTNCGNCYKNGDYYGRIIESEHLEDVSIVKVEVDNGNKYSKGTIKTIYFNK